MQLTQPLFSALALFPAASATVHAAPITERSSSSSTNVVPAVHFVSRPVMIGRELDYGAHADASSIRARSPNQAYEDILAACVKCCRTGKLQGDTAGDKALDVFQRFSCQMTRLGPKFKRAVQDVVGIEREFDEYD